MSHRASSMGSLGRLRQKASSVGNLHLGYNSTPLYVRRASISSQQNNGHYSHQDSLPTLSLPGSMVNINSQDHEMSRHSSLADLADLSLQLVKILFLDLNLPQHVFILLTCLQMSSSTLT